MTIKSFIHVDHQSNGPNRNHSPASGSTTTYPSHVVANWLPNALSVLPGISSSLALVHLAQGFLLQARGRLNRPSFQPSFHHLAVREGQGIFREVLFLVLLGEPFGNRRETLGRALSDHHSTPAPKSKNTSIKQLLIPSIILPKSAGIET